MSLKPAIKFSLFFILFLSISLIKTSEVLAGYCGSDVQVNGEWICDPTYCSGPCVCGSGCYPVIDSSCPQSAFGVVKPQYRYQNQATACTHC